MFDSGLKPHPQQIIAAYDRLFCSDTPLSKLKDAAFSGRLFPQSHSQDVLGIPGRSVAWKLFLIPTVPLTPPASQLLAKPPLTELRERRQEYASLLLEKMCAPDGSYEDGFSVPGVDELPRPSDGDANMNLQRNNPLSLHEDNPWKDWFAAVDLRKTILQDVERTFPDHEYFRDPEVQVQLTNILYIYSTTHPDIGYRQGMHELLAPLFHAVDYDSLPVPREQDFPSEPSSSAASGVSEELTEFCSRTWVSADAWALFSIVMSGVGMWYEWREPTIPPPLPYTPLPQYRHGPPEGQTEFSLKPYVAPIVLACQKLQSQMLKSADPVLWQAMQKSGIEPQIYGIRWLRLLFTREFPLRDAMILWDGVFSCDDTFKLVPWICVAMLIRIRNQLIPSDYSTQLTYLLRYPSPSPSPSNLETDPTTPHHAILLLRQAFALYTSPNPSTGSSIAIENRNLLDIPLEVPEPADRKKVATGPGLRERRVRSNTDVRRAATGASASGRSAFVSGSGTGTTVRQSHLPSQTSNVQVGFPELLARGILEKSESLGINKTVMNAVSELRKNIPELASQLIGSPSPPHESASTNAAGPVPLASERPPVPHQVKAKSHAQTEVRPPWEHRTRVEMEREIAQLRGLQKKLGDAVSVAVDALLQDESVEEEGEEVLKRIRNRKREAIESLAHVRDLLLGATGELDEERLFGEEEYRRRKLLASRSGAGSSSAPGRGNEATMPPSLPPPRPPEPAAAAPASAPIANRLSSEHHQRQKSSPPLISLPRAAPPPRQPPEHVSLKRVGQLTTLPRQRSGGGSGSSQLNSISNANANTFHAPWNYTKSNFSTPTLNSTGGVSLPRPLPRSSQSPVSARSSTERDWESDYSTPEMPVSGRQVRKTSHDPLGALSS